MRGAGIAQPHPRARRCSHCLPAPPQPSALPRRGALTDSARVAASRAGVGDGGPGSSPAPACAPPARSPWGGGDSGAERGPRGTGRERGEPAAGPAQGRPRFGAWRGGRGGRRRAASAEKFGGRGAGVPGREAAERGPCGRGRARGRRGVRRVPGAARPPRRKVSLAPGTKPPPPAGPGPRSGMGEHPSPGPAVAAGAEAERIEELGPEADERPPVAPEDVSAPSPPGQTFWGALRGELPRLASVGQLGGFKVTRERPGLAGSPRTGGGGGTGLPKSASATPSWAPAASLRDAARAAALGTVGRRGPFPAAGAVPGTRRFPAEAAASQQ